MGKFRINGKFVSFKDFLKADPENINRVNRAELTKDQLGFVNRSTAARENYEKRITVKGKFVKHEFERTIKEFAKNNGMEVSQYVKTNRAQIENFYQNSIINYSYRSGKIYDKIETFKGTFKINGKQMSKGEALKTIKEFEQKQRTTRSAAEIIFFMEYHFGGDEFILDLGDAEVIVS